jgi:hypothetical protein
MNAMLKGENLEYYAEEIQNIRENYHITEHFKRAKESEKQLGEDSLELKREK